MTVPQEDARAEADRRFEQPQREPEPNESTTASEYVNLSMDTPLGMVVRAHELIL